MHIDEVTGYGQSKETHNIDPEVKTPDLITSAIGVYANPIDPEIKRILTRSRIKKGSKANRNSGQRLLSALAIGAVLYSSTPVSQMILENRPVISQTEKAEGSEETDVQIRSVISNPENIYKDLVGGKISPENIYYSNTVLNRDGSQRDRSAIPINFVDDEKKVAFSYYPAISEPQIGDYNEDVIKITEMVEGDVETNNSIETVDLPEEMVELEKIIEEKIGDIGYTNSDKLLFTILYRAAQGVRSGGSTPDMQLVKNLVGRSGDESTINPKIKQDTVYSGNDSLAYLVNLIVAARKGENASPTKVDPVQEESVPSELKQDISQMIAQYERFIAGQNIVDAVGEQGVMRMYLDSVRLGSAKNGMEIIGINGAALYAFNREVNDLTYAEKLILISTLPHGSSAPRIFEDKDSLPEVREAILNASLTNLKNSINKGLVSQDNAEDIENQIKDIFEQHKFSGKVPEHMKSAYLLEPDLPENIRAQVESAISSKTSDLLNSSIVNFNEYGINIEVSGFPEKETYRYDHERRFNSIQVEIGNTFDSDLESQLNASINSENSQIIIDGRKYSLPSYEISQGEYVNGLTVVVANHNETQAIYDPTEFVNHMYPFQPGSTIKPFLTLFALKEGLISSFDDKLPDGAGPYMLDGSKDYITNPSPDRESVTVKEALELSHNVPFQALLKAYFDKDTEGLDLHAIKILKESRMTQLNEFLLGFGIKFVDINGDVITHPDQVPQLGMGTLVYVTASDASFDSTSGVLSLKTGSVEAYANAYLEILRRAKAGDEDAKNLIEVLSTYGVTDGKTYEANFGKTGTVGTTNGVVTSLAINVVSSTDGGDRVVLVKENGQEINSSGRPEEIDISDNNSHRTAAVLSKHLVVEANYAKDSVIPSRKIENIYLEFSDFEKVKPHDDLRIVQVFNKNDAENVMVYNSSGVVIDTLSSGTYVDSVGPKFDNKQQITIRRKTSTDGKEMITTGFIDVNNISDLNNQELRESNVADLIRSISNESVSQYLRDKKIIVVSRESESLLIRNIALQMEEQNKLTVGEEYLWRKINGVDSSVLFVSEERLKDFTTYSTNEDTSKKELLDALLNQEFERQIHISNFYEVAKANDDIEMFTNMIRDKDDVLNRLINELINDQVLDKSKALSEAVIGYHGPDKGRFDRIYGVFADYDYALNTPDRSVKDEYMKQIWEVLCQMHVYATPTEKNILGFESETPKLVNLPK